LDISEDWGIVANAEGPAERAFCCSRVDWGVSVVDRDGRRGPAWLDDGLVGVVDETPLTGFRTLEYRTRHVSSMITSMIVRIIWTAS
jgi:hypothetical protein